MKKIIILSIVFLLLFGVFIDSTNAVVRVKGYYRKDGTYVQPYVRTDPDGIISNNYSYPGNYNPNTGKITPGNPITFPLSSTGAVSSQSMAAVKLNEGDLVKSPYSSTVYYIQGAFKAAIPSVATFNAYGFSWNNVKTVDTSSLVNYSDKIVLFPVNKLLKSPGYPFVWLITTKTNSEQRIRKWVVTGKDFENCGFSWSSILTVSENDIQNFEWAGQTPDGLIQGSVCQ